MKTKRLLLAVVCLVLFAGTGQTQQTPPNEQEQGEQMPMSLKTPVIQRTLISGNNAMVRSFWEGFGADAWAFEMLRRNRILQKAWDISDEQYQKIVAMTMSKHYSTFQNNCQQQFMQSPVELGLS